jgi:hypothetical protein
MNNFSALSQYIASVNQAVNSLAKNNVDMMNRLKNVESANGGADVDKIMRLIDDGVSTAIKNAKSEILAEVSASISKLSERLTTELEAKLGAELEAKLGAELEAKLGAELEAKLGALQSAQPQQHEFDEIIIPELAPEVVNLAGSGEADDDIIIGMKKEDRAPRRRGKPRAT